MQSTARTQNIEKRKLNEIHFRSTAVIEIRIYVSLITSGKLNMNVPRAGYVHPLLRPSPIAISPLQLKSSANKF